jgi:16S rRNA (adenine1518-N6/adenine1519-N6)-dimethyltransferase
MPAKKSLGQHFLVSAEVIARIVELCRFVGREAQGVAEIGPGRGALTSGLAGLGLPLWVVEADDALAEAIGQRFPGVLVENVDARTVDWCGIPRVTGLHPWLLAANLPYNAGTEILWQTLLRRDVFCALVVMLQREVAQKFCADAGEEGYCPYGAWADPWWERRLLFTVKPGAFRPQPKVTSAVCAFTPKEGIPLSSSAMADYWDFVRAAFRQPRKTLAANLVDRYGGRETVSKAVDDLAISPLSRPGEISARSLVNLFSILRPGAAGTR